MGSKWLMVKGLQLLDLSSNLILLVFHGVKSGGDALKTSFEAIKSMKDNLKSTPSVKTSRRGGTSSIASLLALSFMSISLQMSLIAQLS